jgi:phage-related baseplate assembly protein
MSDPFANTPDVNFAVKDPTEIENSVITGFETAWYLAEGTSLKLYPGDPRRLFLLTIADLIVAQRVAIDFAAKQNLLKYARGDYLKQIAALYGERGNQLTPTSATTTLEFAVTAPMAFDNIIPQWTQAAAGPVVFQTDYPVTLRATELTVTAPATCATPGQAGNGLIPGQINQLVNWALPFAASVKNTTESTGGSDEETDDHYRNRIWELPESFSTCGPVGAYHSWAMTASPDLLDVTVYSDPSIAGQVWLYPLMKGGQLPSQQILDAVLAACNPDKKRPLTDQVKAFSPVPSLYKLDMTYWILESQQVQAGTIQTNVMQAVDDWILWQRSLVGRDLNPDELIKGVIEAGAKRCDIRDPKFTVLNYDQLAICSDPDIKIDFGGFESE